MYGVNFISGYNSLIVLGCKFSVRGFSDTPEEIYEWNAGPSGERLSRQNHQTGEWEIVNKTLEDILPSSFGLDWKTGDFILALSFWAEGKDVGKAQARASCRGPLRPPARFLPECNH